MSYGEDKLLRVQEQLESHGPWQLMAQATSLTSFGNKYATLTNGQLAIRFSMDREFEHLDLGRPDAGRRTEWVPLEVVALAAGALAPGELLQHHRDCCAKLDEATGRFDAEPLLPDPLSLVRARWPRLTRALGSQRALHSAKRRYGEITKAAINEIRPMSGSDQSSVSEELDDGMDNTDAGIGSTLKAGTG
jgi:hypothetical protein